MAKISFLSKVRTWIRKYIRKWWWFKAVKIYGNHLHPTVRLSRTTSLDKTNPGGVYVDEYTYFAGEVMVLAHDMCRELNAKTIIGKNVLSVLILLLCLVFIRTGME